MYTIEEIIHLTGIPTNTASEVCHLLCGEGYLVFDENTGKYRLTKEKDLLKKISKVKEQISKPETAHQVYSKIQDIINLGKPLALSELGKEKTVEDIGIPGLNIIFGGLSGNKGGGTPGTPPHKNPGLPRGHCLLVKGAPGTGKTTMGMQIALHLAKDYRAMFLTFEEDVDQLCGNLKAFCKDQDGKPSGVGWNESEIKKVTKSITKIRTPSAWEDTDVVMQEIIKILDRELPQLIVIDSVSRFRDIGGDINARQVLRRLIRALKIRGITSIFLGEERGEVNSFEEYETDGIIHLEWNGDQLSMEVVKLRGRKSYKGPHSAALITADDLEDVNRPEHLIISEKHFKGKKEAKSPHLRTGFNVFPEISVYKDIYRQQENNDKKDRKKIPTGTSGLDDLLPWRADDGDRKGFKEGETILIIGSAGSGKTLLALNFMLDEYKKIRNNESSIKGKNGKDKVAIWLNFEGDIGTLRFAVDGFEGDLGTDLEEMVDSADLDKKKNNKKEQSNTNGQKDNHKEYFKFFSFPPINLDLNRIVYIIESILVNHTIDRLVIDSITELERAKGGGQPEIKTFLAGLIQYLRDRDITTMFISRSDTFFRSIDKIEEQVSSLVDLIICIRNFDMHNQINKGIYIQKARGRAHNSKIMRMTIDARQGIEIEDSGWDVENLLAGDTSFIQGPRIFFKLFYENPAEKTVNESIIRDFGEDRYPGEEPAFSLVRKDSIHTEFWSFRGQYSAGHANTRVLSIADHVISAFRDNEKLTELKDYVKNELLRSIQRDKELIRLFNPYDDKKKGADSKDNTSPGNENKKKPDPNEENSHGYGDADELPPEAFEIDAIPCYRDYGVMVFETYPGEKGSPFKSCINECLEKTWQNDNYQDDYNWCKVNYTWENLVELIKEAKTDIKPSLFAFPGFDNKSEFIAFFMELLWSYGGDIYNIPIDRNYKHKGYRKGFKQKIRESIIFDLRECEEQLLENSEPNAIRFDKKKYKKDEYSSRKKIINKLFSGSAPVKFFKYKQLEKRFNTYGIGQGHVKFDKFLDWVVTYVVKKKKKAISKPPILSCNDDEFKETIKLVMRLIHEAGVRNPIHGDFRDEAMLSRRWYSQLNHMDLEDRKLLPIPLVKHKVKDRYYYRSVTCITYWSLVMLGNALSPEIGGNFIESMNSPGYYRDRLKMRVGMPIRNWELKREKYKNFDPASYELLARIIDNNAQYEKAKENISQAVKDEENCKNILGAIAGNDYAFIGMKPFEVLKKEKDKEKKDDASIDQKPSDLQEGKKEGQKKDPFEELKEQLGKVGEDKLNKRIFFHKPRHSRIAFYQIEQALHFQLRKLLLKERGEVEDEILSGIYEEMEYSFTTDDVRKQEIKEEYKQKKRNIPNWDTVSKKFTNELTIHLVLELLMYFYREDDRKNK